MFKSPLYLVGFLHYKESLYNLKKYRNRIFVQVGNRVLICTNKTRYNEKRN